MEFEFKYIPGDNWCICDMCGFKKRASSLRYNHNGLLVCSDTCWEPRHPQETIKHVREKITPDKVRSEATDVFITTAITQDDL